MTSTRFGLLTLFLTLALSFEALGEPRLTGTVKLFDATGAPIKISSIRRRLRVRFYRLDANGKPKPCSGKTAVVSSDTGRFTYVPTGRCYTLHRQKLDVPLLGFKLLSVPTVAVEENMADTDTEALTLQRHSGSIAREEIEASFREGTRLYRAGSRDRGLAFLSEAAQADPSYASRSLGFVEAIRRDEAKDVLTVEEIFALDLNRNETYNLLMRRGHSARAAADLADSLSTYAAAQKLAPSSREPVSISLTMLRQNALRTYRPVEPEKLAAEMSKHPELVSAWEQTYDAWQYTAKPHIDFDEQAGLQNSLKFAQRNIQSF